ncbi:hypothetical protein HanIR_Chr16g0830481 [Helianthus annuus]|nr:hypothetical protein HanIR_Chr16g0830481 [Helianthus annuus]
MGSGLSSQSKRCSSLLVLVYGLVNRVITRRTEPTANPNQPHLKRTSTKPSTTTNRRCHTVIGTGCRRLHRHIHSATTTLKQHPTNRRTWVCKKNKNIRR